MKEAGLTSDQTEIIRKKFGETIYTRSTRGLVGRKITEEEIRQLKEAGVDDKQMEVVRKLFETSPWPRIHLPTFVALMEPALTEAQILDSD